MTFLFFIETPITTDGIWLYIIGKNLKCFYVSILLYRGFG